jgi:hypothetical protein
VKGFDVWKLLGGKGPRGYKPSFDSLARDATKAAGATRVNPANAKKSMGSSLDSTDMAALLIAAGIPLGTFMIAKKATDKRREASQ